MSSSAPESSSNNNNPPPQPPPKNPHAQFAQYPSLKSKIILITGGAEGIGASCVSQFAHQNSQVLFLDISTSSAHHLISRLREEGVSSLPIFYHCDVTNLPQLQSVCEEILQTFGKVDVLVNNAAAAGQLAREATQDVTEETFQWGVNVNLRHILFLTKWIARSMISSSSSSENDTTSSTTRTGGSIINMGSITWRIPSTGVPVYAMCKAAIMGLTRTHAREFGTHGIRVNSVLPGSIATARQLEEVLSDEKYVRETLEAQALKRMLGPDEVGRLVLFLASEDASAITGSNYVCDGGWVGDV